MSINLVNVYVYDMYKEWNWEINILYFAFYLNINTCICLVVGRSVGRYFYSECAVFILTSSV